MILLKLFLISYPALSLFLFIVAMILTSAAVSLLIDECGSEMDDLLRMEQLLRVEELRQDLYEKRPEYYIYKPDKYIFPSL